MSGTPTVSVLMPVYNGERFLAEAIDSVLTQSLSDFELVIVDDGSTDRTREILSAYQLRDPRIIVHRHEHNLGFRAALNNGAQRARGALIARLDADDVSLPVRLDMQVQYMTAHPDVAVLGSAVQLIDASGVRGVVKRYPRDPASVAWSMRFFNSVAHPATMIRREVLERAGFFPSGCEGGTEDYALFMRLSRTVRLANLDDVLLLYRTWPGNMSKVSEDKQERDAVRILRQCLEEWGVTLTVAEAEWLRGLSRDRFPYEPADLESVGRVIGNLIQAFPGQAPVRREELTAPRSDAAVRLWLLGALALRRSPRSFLRLASQATRLSPSSFWQFASKAVKVVARNAARRR